MSQEVYELERGLERIRTEIKRITSNTLRPAIVGVAGGSGSGKTTKVAEKIKEMFLNSQVLSMDDYFRGQEFMQSINSCNWDEPRVYELDLLQQHLKILKRYAPIQKPVYSFSEGRRLRYESFEPKEIVILEGLFALYPGIVDELDLKIFVDIAVHGSLIRRILRDVKRTGQTEQDIFKQYVETVYPMFKLHVEPTRAAADIVIVNHYVPEVETECCESREIQIKASLRNQLLPEKLRALGFVSVGVVHQTDTYYTAPNWQNAYADELMRIRQQGGRYFLAYKGPSEDGSLSRKPKIEFEVEPLLKDALQKLGYQETLCLIKRRERFIGRGLELVIDKFTNGRWFLELRTADPAGEAAMLDCLRDLGISQESMTKKSYLEIFAFNKQAP